MFLSYPVDVGTIFQVLIKRVICLLQVSVSLSKQEKLFFVYVLLIHSTKS
jgi:hypothetical protein